MQKFYVAFVFLSLTTLTTVAQASNCKTLNLEIEKAIIESRADLSEKEKADHLEENKKLHAAQVIACAMKRRSINEADGQAAIFQLRGEFFSAESELKAKIEELSKDEDENSAEIESLKIDLNTARTENRQIIRRIEGLIAGGNSNVVAGN